MGNGIYLKMLKQEKQYRFVILANIISRFGDSIDSIAYSWLVYGLTNSKSWLAITVGVNMIPTILFQPFGGALTEFLNKKKAVIYCDFGRGVIVFITALFYISGLLRPWHLLVFTFLNSTLEAVRVPNGAAMLPEILSKENYKSAIALNQGASRTAELLGLGLAAFIIGLLGVGGAICIDAVTFILSGILYTFIKIKNADRERIPFEISKYKQSMKEGSKFFFKNDIAVMVCLVCIVLNIIGIPVINMQIAYVSEYLKLGLTAISLGSVVKTLGAVIGALLLPRLTQKSKETAILLWGGITIGLLYFLFVIVGGIPAYYLKYGSYLLAALAFGVVDSLINVAVQVVFVTRIPKEFLGRIGGIFNSLACSSIPVGSFVIAGIGSKLSMKELYILTGIITMIAFLLIGRLKAVKEINSERGF